MATCKKKRKKRTRTRKKTSRPRAPERTTESLLRETTEIAAIGGWEYDITRDELVVNDQAYKICEVPPQTRLGAKQALAFFDPDSRPSMDFANRQAIAQGQPYDLELELDTARGRHIWVRCMCQPQQRKGETIRLVGLIQDITKQKEAEGQFMMQAKVLESMTEGVIVTDNEGYIVHTNPTQDRMFDYEAGELVGKHVSVLSAYDPETNRKLFERIKVYLAKRGNWGGEFENKRKDGTKFVTVTRITTIEHGGTSYHVYVQDDVTELRSVEYELDKQRALAIQNEKMAALGQMSGGVAHEINNPLTIIDGFAKRIRKLYKKGTLDPEEMDRIVGKIEGTVVRISKIVAALRRFSRDSTQEEFKDTLASAVVSTTLDLCHEKLKNDGVTVNVKNSEEQTLFPCQEVALSQVLLNMITNSYDAIIHQTEKWINIDIRRLGDRIEFSVTDSGNGIDTETADKILDPFFTTKEVGKGTGLGLSISKGIVEDHGGRIYLDSKSANTRFVIELPLFRSDQTIEAA